jgi:hypothetical protein
LCRSDSGPGWEWAKTSSKGRKTEIRAASRNAVLIQRIRHVSTLLPEAAASSCHLKRGKADADECASQTCRRRKVNSFLSILLIMIVISNDIPVREDTLFTAALQKTLSADSLFCVEITVSFGNFTKRIFGKTPLRADQQKV